MGCLEEILISEEFEEIQSEFIKEKCKEFTSLTENKPEYIVHFKNYQKAVESYLEKVTTCYI